MSKLQSKVLGSLVGASAGDAMGAATELRTIEQIKNDFDGWVTTFIAPPQDTFGRCNAAGMVTDDFTQGKFILEAALEQNGDWRTVLLTMWGVDDMAVLNMILSFWFVGRVYERTR